LTASTTYYVRAYATNSVGTGYGTQLSFTTASIPNIPSVTTTAISSITSIIASGGGNVTSDGGGTVTVRGVCWNILINPTTANSKTTDGSGTGIFTSSLTSLTDLTHYYVRAYATNATGTAYGGNVEFTATDIITPPTPTNVWGDYVFSSDNKILFYGDKIVVYSPGTVTPPAPSPPYPNCLNTNTWAWYIFDSLATVTKDAYNYVSGWADYLGSGHDLLQTTYEYQPQWTSTGILFDASSGYDMLKTATATLAQPVTIYILFKQLTWIDQSYIFDGFTPYSCVLAQRVSTPRLRMYAGITAPYSDELAVNTWGVVICEFNGVSSTIQVDDNTPVTGNSGTNSMAGFTLGNSASGWNQSNILVKEVIIRTVIDNSTDKISISNRLKNQK